MSLPWRAELRVGLCPGRLVLPGGERPCADDLADELARIGKGRRVTVVLSSHFVRHALLPWSDALGADEEWLALARHTFTATHGPAAEGWDCRVSPGGRGEPRLASAVDASLLEALRRARCVVSVQPYLMSAFNARRRALAGRTGWFLVQEPGRAVLALVRGGAWRLVRTRGIDGRWPEFLPDLLDRESAALEEESCEDVFVYGADESPAQLGGYRITDVTLAKGAKASRAAAMVLH